MENTLETQNYSSRHTAKASTTLNRKYVKRPWANSDATDLETAIHQAKTNSAREELAPKVAAPESQTVSKTEAPKVKVRESSTLEQDILKNSISHPQIKRFSTHKITVSDGSLDKSKKDVRTNDITPAAAHPLQIRANEIMKAEKSASRRPSAKELKDAAIKKALAEAGITEEAPFVSELSGRTGNSQISTKRESPFKNPVINSKSAKKTSPVLVEKSKTGSISSKKNSAPKSSNLTAIASSAANSTKRASKMNQKTSKTSHNFSFGRFVIALSASVAAVFSIIYFANLGSPDISFSVAAAESGFDAAYPSYIPRDFSLKDISSTENQVIMIFENSSTGDSFRLSEEKSSYDSEALEKNLGSNFANGYSTVREQGLTIFVSNSSHAAWVSGGVYYQITPLSGELTKKQLVNIATSI